MHDLFYFCVDVLRKIAGLTGLTYEEANIWIFVIIHPLITLIFILLFIIYYKKYKQGSKKNLQ